MDRFKITLFTVLAIGVLGAQTAGAQTAANISPVTGNGQVVCQTCTGAIFRFFLPMAVKVTDSAGQPIPNKIVNWNLISSQGPPPFFASQTFTDGAGVAQTFLNQASQAGSFAQQYLQTVIQATADGVSTNFTETQGLSDSFNHQLQFINARLDSPGLGVTLQGTAGAPGTSPIRIHVDAFGIPIPGVSVRLLNAGDPAKTPSAACATGANADPGSVLTDANGDGVCTPVFGAMSGNGSFTVLVGGIDPAIAPDYAGTPTPVGYFQSGAVLITVKAGVPGLIQIVSGNSQSINPGQQSSPLTVKVTDITGVNGIPNAIVVWSATPLSAVSFNPISSTTNSLGVASTVATVSSSAAGAVAIRAQLTGAQSNIATTFALNVNVVVTGLQKVSGDTQISPVAQVFGQPLVVQVNGSTGQPVANFPVAFSILGPGSLSSSTANTNASGRAQVNVTAGSSQGTVTVTASAGAFIQTFSLTVIPPGPNLTVNSFVNGADFQRGALSPCSIATVVAFGLAPAIQGVVVPTSLVGALPYLLAGDRVSFGSSQAPIFNLSNLNSQQQITVQVPCDVTPGTAVPVTINVSGGSATINIPIQPASPGIFQMLMSDGVTRAVLVRPDGSFVSVENPARRDEVIRAYVTGMGPVTPAVATNSVAVPGTDSLVVGQVIVGVNNAGARVISARQAPNLVGVQEVAFQVPSDTPVGNDIVFSVAVNVPGDSQTRFSGGSKIPIL